jgi:hypothetical protein
VFIGHFALAFAAKRAAPRMNLGVLFVAVALADVLWPVFLILGLEHVRIDPGNTAFTPLDFVSYPYSHSLLALAVWGVALGWIARDADRARHLPLVAGLVLSHWILDVVTHRPDMPIVPFGGPRIGLGLWNSIPLTALVESAMFLGGVWMYLACTRARDAVGRWSTIALVAFLLLAYFGDMPSTPPPNIPALEILAIAATVIIVIWSAWADAHREATCRMR